MNRKKLKKSTVKQNDFEDEEEEEEDYGIPLNSSGSVLTPSGNPYNMSEKLREANARLAAENKTDKNPRTPPKVRFVEPVPVEDDHGEDQLRANEHPEEESKPLKILLVTLPSAYSIDSEDILTDEEYEDDLFFSNDDFRGSGYFQQNTCATISESEEEIEDSTLPLTEETLTSLETVICRSETEESELTECFSKSINLNIENDIIDTATLDSNIVDFKETVGKLNVVVEEFQLVVDNTCKEEVILDEKLLKYHDNYKQSHNTSVESKPSELKVYNRPTTDSIIKKKKFNERPSTAPVKRLCSKLGMVTKLPAYSGLKSEYGLSKEQLLEKEKKKNELLKLLKIEREKNLLEERRRQKENEVQFKNWLIKKKKEAEAKTLRKIRQSNFGIRTIPAPTAHLDRIGALRKKILKQENTYLLLDEIFRNARPQEKKTFKIYLGLCV